MAPLPHHPLVLEDEGLDLEEQKMQQADEGDDVVCQKQKEEEHAHPGGLRLRWRGRRRG